MPDWLPDKMGDGVGNIFFIPDKQPNQIVFIPYIYPLSSRTGREYAQSIYPKYPYTHFKGNQNPIQRKTSVW